MPIYEFICRECDHAFEALVARPGAKALCPECGSWKVTQAMSAPGSFSVKGDGACSSMDGGTCSATGNP